MPPIDRGRLIEPLPARVMPVLRGYVPLAVTAVASLAPLLPMIASVPLLPPLSLITLVAWRLLRGDVWPLWVALPLGMWDDLLSGAPIGTSVCGWTAVLLALDIVDARMPWRSFRTDWAIGVVAIGSMLLFALLMVRNIGSTPAVALLLPQFILSALLFPPVSRLCALLDRWRTPRGIA